MNELVYAPPRSKRADRAELAAGEATDGITARLDIELGPYRSRARVRVPAKIVLMAGVVAVGLVGTLVAMSVMGDREQKKPDRTRLSLDANRKPNKRLRG